MSMSMSMSMSDYDVNSYTNCYTSNTGTCYNLVPGTCIFKKNTSINYYTGQYGTKFSTTRGYCSTGNTAVLLNLVAVPNPDTPVHLY